MAAPPLHVEKGVITAPTTTGQQTYTLPTGFDAKALMLAATYETADGITNGNGIMSLGFGTYDGALVQQQYLAGVMEDAAATSNTADGWDDTAILKGFSNATPTIDYEARLVSLGSSSFVLDWVNAPANAILVHYWVLGGDAIENARSGSIQYASFVSGEDVTIRSGFGQPELVFFLARGSTSKGDTLSGGCYLTLGVAISDFERAALLFRSADTSATIEATTLRTMRATVDYSDGLGARMVELAPRDQWPQDGFRIANVGNQPAQRAWAGYLALSGPFVASIGYATTPTDPDALEQFFSMSWGAAKGALFWGGGIPIVVDAINIDTLSADVDAGEFWVGMTDGVNEGMCAVVEDHAAASSNSGRVFSSTKAVANHVADAAGGAPTLNSEADVTLVDSAARLNYTAPDSRSRELNWLVIGELPDNYEELLTQGVYEKNLASGGGGLGA